MVFPASQEVHPYAASAYGRALAPGGAAVAVDAWGAQVLTRPITGSDRLDAFGTYPMTPVAAGADLRAGLAQLAAAGLVSVVLVPDPLAGPTQARLAEAFALCRPFKTHYVVDRSAGPFAPTKHHRAEIRRAQRRCSIEQVRLADCLTAWTALYDGLVERRAVSGVAAFGPAYFEMLAAQPRMTAFAARIGDEIAAMTIWFEHDGVAYNHLGASNALGYANGANYALYDAAIAHFENADRLNLGGSAGATNDPADGLAFFKRGFANAEATALLCGAVLDRPRYDVLAADAPASGYFPAYRG